MSARTSPGRPSATAALSVPVAFLLANAASYGLVLTAAHRMSAPAYGALSSLLGLLLISTIPMLALQTVAARLAATGAGASGIMRGSAEVAALATVTVCVLSPGLAIFLHLDDVVGILLVAATIPATAVLGAAMGLAQGARRFGRLAVLLLAATGSRSLGGLAGLLIGDTVDSTLLGVVCGTGVAAVVVVVLVHPSTTYRVALFAPDRGAVVRETLHAGHAHGTFLLLTSVDVLLARHVLSASDAGLYAVGSVLTRATVWLPQSVIMLLFASLVESHSHRLAARRAAATVCGLGALCVVGSAALGGVLVSIVGGAKYHRLDATVWLFALLGALLAVLQLAVLAGLAQRNARRAAILWATIAVDVVVVSTGAAASPTRLVATLVCVSAIAATVALWMTLRQPEVVAGHGPGVNVGSMPFPNAGATPEATG